MRSWLFIFGRTSELSFHEIASVTSLPITRISPDVVRVQDREEQLVPEQLITRLGGTVKIAREKGNIAAITPEALSGFFEDECKALTFGVSVYGGARPVDSAVLHGMKKSMESRGVRARYVAAREGKALSSVVIAKQHVRELILVATHDGFTVAETAAVQDFEAWNRRDWGRPFADPKSGMLPPKVARMAVNLAHSEVLHLTSEVLLDPFCGMGTILGEAILTGWRVYGSDQSQEVVEKAKKNLEFLQVSQGTSLQSCKEVPYVFFISDATHVSEHIPAQSIDAIVTEPYLGPATIEAGKAKDIIKGLEKLYIGCLRDWHKVLKASGKIVIALPEYAINGKMFFVKTVIDRCETFGYTVSQGPLTYSREHAIVRRKFYVLVKLG